MYMYVWTVSGGPFPRPPMTHETAAARPLRAPRIRANTSPALQRVFLVIDAPKIKHKQTILTIVST